MNYHLHGYRIISLCSFRFRWICGNWKYFNKRSSSHNDDVHYVWRFHYNAWLPWNSHVDFTQQTSLHHETTGKVHSCTAGKSWKILILVWLPAGRDSVHSRERQELTGVCQKKISANEINCIIFQLYSLRRLMQGFFQNPKAPLGNNFRAPQHLYGRPVRTNIDFRRNQVS